MIDFVLFDGKVENLRPKAELIRLLKEIKEDGYDLKSESTIDPNTFTPYIERMWVELESELDVIAFKLRYGI